MAITLKSLLSAASFPKEEIDTLMAKQEYLTDEEKFELANDAWFILSQKYFSMLELEKKIIYEEIAQGKRKYNPNDLEEARARLLYEFSQKLEATENQESIEEVRKNLEKFKTQPLVQDKLASTPPACIPIESGSIAGRSPQNQ